MEIHTGKQNRNIPNRKNSSIRQPFGLLRVLEGWNEVVSRLRMSEPPVIMSRHVTYPATSADATREASNSHPPLSIKYTQDQARQSSDNDDKYTPRES